VIVASVYAVWYVLSLHLSIPGPNSSGTIALSFGGGSAVADKTAEVFRDAPAILLGAVTLLILRRGRA